MSKAIEAIKTKARTQSTEMLLNGLILMEAKPALEQHERMVRACLCDVVEERKGEEFIEYVLDCLEEGKKIILN